MTFSNPLALLLLLSIPYFAWLGWPRVAHRRRRDLTSLSIRLVVVTLLILGLAGLQTAQAADKLSVVFLLDESDSVDAATRAEAEQYMRDAMASMGLNDSAGVVVFGKNALIERPVSSVKALGPITSVPIRLNTNIAEAIHLGLAMLPGDSAKRLVILSDGQENLGSAIEAARLAAATNVQIDVVPLTHHSGPEVLVSDVRAPTTVNQGETFDLGVTVQSTIDTPATLTVLSAGAVIQSKQVALKSGDNNFVLTLTATHQGFTDFEARIDPPPGTDSIYQNKQLSAFTEVTGPPHILLVSPNPDEVKALLPALQSQGLNVDLQTPDNMPSGLAELASYKTVVLANVSATKLDNQQMKVLQSYVRDLGGGLVAIGGADSYGPGGYFQTPLEETLPLESQIKDQKRIPSLLMVYVIDRSGSMEVVEPGSTVDRLELGKEAIRRSIQFLLPQDHVGVVSYDSDAYWVVPVQPVTSNPQPIIDQVGTLRSGGGDGTLNAMQEAFRQMAPDTSSLKHMIILTDGDDSADGLVALAQQMYTQSGITVTTIDIESGEEQPLIDTATAGHGLYYHLVTLQNLPQIFVADTVLATRSYIQEKEFTPQQNGNSAIMQGINSTPSLLGYVATTPKPNTSVILSVPGFNDPLLASWQYGLGRAVAWTSDAASRWSKNWTGWDNYGRFWSQVVRSTITEGTNNRLDAQVEQRPDGQFVLTVNAVDSNGSFLNGLAMNASVVDPKLQAQSIPLDQIAPGRYEGTLDPKNEGAYFIRVGGSASDTSGGNVGIAQTTGWVLSYSPEYRLQDTNLNLLNQIATLTSGKIIQQQPSLSFAHTISETRASASVWPLLLLLVTFLLPIDIATRRIVVTRSDMEKATNWTRKRLGIQPPAPTLATSGKLTRLKDAKERAVSPLPSQTSPVKTEAVRDLLRSRRASTVRPMDALHAERYDPPAQSDPGRSQESTASPTSPATPPVNAPEAVEAAESQQRHLPEQPQPEAGDSLASRLVDRRRHRKDN